MLYNLNVFAMQNASDTNSSLVFIILMFAIMFAILYFIVIRPQQKQQKNHNELIAALKKGDNVILTSGIIGKIYTVENDIISLEVSDKIRIKILKNSVQAINNIQKLNIK